MHRSCSRPQASLAAVRKNAADLNSLVVQLDTAPVREAHAIGSRQSIGNLSGEGCHTLAKARHGRRLGFASAAGIAMRSGLLLAIGVVTLAVAAVGEGEIAAGLHFYESAEFGKAAAWFQPVCNHNANAAACYWTGLSYERLGDTKIPFGCSTSRKAQEYFAKALALAPGRTEYRDALFDFLLDNADCSRTAIRQAAEMLTATPESDPDYPRMRGRLQEAVRWNTSLESRLSNVFLLIPRTAHRAAAWPAAALGSLSAGETARE